MLVAVAQSKMTAVEWLEFFFFLSRIWKEELTCLPDKPNTGRERKWREGAVKVFGQSS